MSKWRRLNSAFEGQRRSTRNINKRMDKTIDEKRSRIDFLTEKLNEASRAYYTDGTEIITNYEYDEMYD